MLSINDWEVASMLVFQVCFVSNSSKVKFQTVTSSMQIGGVTVQNHDWGL